MHPSEKKKKTCLRMSMIQLQHAAFMCRWLIPVRTMCVHLIIGNAYSWHGFSLNHRCSRNATHVPTGIAYIHILTHNISMSQKTTDLLSVLQMPPPHPALKKLLQEAAAGESGNGEGAGCAMDIGFILLKHALVAVTHRGGETKRRNTCAKLSRNSAACTVPSCSASASATQDTTCCAASVKHSF